MYNTYQPGLAGLCEMTVMTLLPFDHNNPVTTLWQPSDNPLITLGNDPIRPYDILISGEFLRSDLKTYLKSKNVTVENKLLLEYVEAPTPPEELPDNPSNPRITLK